MTYSRIPPTEPGYYWFFYEFYDPKKMGRRSEIREVTADSEGKLYVRMDISKWDWGPDPRYMAMSHAGYWSEKILNPFSLLEEMQEDGD